MLTVVVDTNVILRYLLNDHPDWSIRAGVFWAKVSQGQQYAYLLEGVLVECVYVLLKVYHVPRTELANRLLNFLEMPGLKASSLPVLRDSLKLFRDHNVDVVDALLIATAQTNSWTVESFDHDLARLSQHESSSR
ncbi:MAG: PIN domain-containing protein [Magnetococcus sp. DMHC-1]|nr:PIN domain-containing protein [Magnetococcales bacterium]